MTMTNSQALPCRGEPKGSGKPNDENKVELPLNPSELPIPIAGRLARIPFPMSEDDFDLFIGTLQLWKKKLVRKLTAVPPVIQLPANAIWKNNDTDKPVKIIAVMDERDGVLFYQSDDGTGIPASQLKF